jgi:LmbE family N-acetylglucosaminyl deacetylase
MKLTNPTSEIFIPDNTPMTEALQRITHLGIGAHQDDLELMAFHGILACYAREDLWFGGVTCTNGSGSSRTGIYADFTDAEMMAVRKREQNAAAVVGGYGVMIQLDHSSSVAKSPADPSLKEDLKQLLRHIHPQVVYTHNPADKHDTHVGVVVAALQAMRELPPSLRPQKVWGCEVWRNLDWLPDSDKVLMDVSGRDNLAAALNGIFDSQIAGGKRYDIATIGRRCANATFFESHATDRTTQLIFGMDLSPVVADPSLDILDYVMGFVRKMESEIREKLVRRLG